MKTKIVAGFPATGKSFIFNNQGCLSGLKILDSDSSDFSWVKDKQGYNTDIRNPNFPNNYIEHIKESIGKVDIIFISSHDVVQKSLKDNNIEYIMIYPDISLKEEWIYRFKSRGNNDNFIRFISSNWEKFIKDIESNSFHTKIKLNEGEFIWDYLDEILG